MSKARQRRRHDARRARDPDGAATLGNAVTRLGNTVTPLRAFHVLTVLGCAATIVLTWPLWQVRTEPPPIPPLPLPAVPCGVPLLAALALALVRPRPGVLAYCAVLAYAIASDWTRLQPSMISFAFLLGAGIPGTAGCTLARVHVLTMWFYAGLNKLLSPGFWSQEDPWILRGVMAEPPAWLRGLYPELVIVGEIGLALAAAYPASRRAAAYWALILHTGILWALLGRGWNPSVWPWNVVLALSGFLLIRPWREGVLKTIKAEPVPIRIAALGLLLYPLGAQVGIGDPYLAHNLYSKNTPLGYVCNRDGPQPERPALGEAGQLEDYEHCRTVDYFTALNLPEPPEHAFIEAYFIRTCTPEETLVIYERRPFFTMRGQQRRVIPCPAG